MDIPLSKGSVTLNLPTNPKQEEEQEECTEEKKHNQQRARRAIGRQIQRNRA
jgi:hypothetical protein